MQNKTPVHPPTQNGFPLNSTGNLVLSSTESQTEVKKGFHTKAVQRLSIAQILLGASAILLQLWDIFNGSVMSVCGPGIWTGILFIIAGSLGIHSSKNRKTCSVVAFLVMSVVASLFTVALLILSAFSVGFAARRRQFYDGSGVYHSTLTETEKEYMINILDMTTAIAALLVVISLIEAVVAIVSSCFACKVLCCSNTDQQSMLIQGQVQYITGPDGQTQIVITPVPSLPNQMTANPPYQLTTPVGGFQTQPLSAPQEEMPSGHAMYPQLHQAQAGAPPQPPTYSEKTAPPPEYEENEKATSG